MPAAAAHAPAVASRSTAHAHPAEPGVASPPPSLVTPRGEPTAAVLEQVRVDARLEGLLLQVQAEQHYRQTGAEPLEVVYVFPLPVGAVLLGLDVTLAGRRLAGTVVARREGERRYEEAMAEGDLPVMVEPLGDQRWRVQLGNLKPGEPVVLALRYAQLASFEQGQVRLAFPSTIAPRYGEPLHGDPLPLYPQRSVTVEHPLQFTLRVLGDLARAEIACPTHPISVAPLAAEAAELGEEAQGTPPGLRLVLGETARLDRDVIVTLRPADVDSVLTAVIDPATAEASATCTVLASFRPQVAAPPRERIDLKVLVDCSGSMAGDSIASAKLALRALADALQPGDRFGFSRFGSTCHHDLRRLAAATPGNLNRLRALVERTDADLGGTEMREALQALFEHVAAPGAPGPIDVLLITDGEVDDRQAIVRLARDSGHRLFAVGVGSSPHEHLLREVAEATGGACEFATPGESLQAAVRRMMARLRQPVVAPLQLVAELGGTPVEPLWVTPLPRGAFGGDTLHVFAAFDATAAAWRPGSERARLGMRLSTPEPAAGGSQPLARASGAWPQARSAEGTAPPTLARMAAWRRLQAMDEDDPAALALALRYQLVTRATRLLCVHERAEEEKVREFAALHHEPVMLAAGWGGVGSARLYAKPTAKPAVLSSAMDFVSYSLSDVSLSIDDAEPRLDLASTDPAPNDGEESTFLASSHPSHVAPPLWTRDEFFRLALDRLASGQSLDVALELLVDLKCPNEVRMRHQELMVLGLDRNVALAVMLRAWAEGQAQLDESIEVVLDGCLADVTEAQWAVAVRPFD